MTKGKPTKPKGSGNRVDNKVHLIPWKPGQSGNPSGRPKMPEEVRKALEAGSAPAARKLVELLDSGDPRVELMAAQAIMDRLYGKPTQQVDAEVRTTNVQQAHLQILLELQAKRDGAMKTIEGGAENPIELKPETPRNSGGEIGS